MRKDFLEQRSRMIKLIRRFFDERGYTEMHTPRLVGLPGQEPHLEPFWTRLRQGSGGQAGLRQGSGGQAGLRQGSGGQVVSDAALITSPEYAMKRLLASGFDKIYDLGPCFRNGEPWDGSHDPEFLLLEWYRKHGALDALMDETEEMVKFVANNVPYSTFRISNRIRRITCEQAWSEYTGIDLKSLIGDHQAMAAIAREKGQTVTDEDTWDDLYFKIFLSEIEPRIASEPTFLYRYPASQAALARCAADDERFAERVELYLGGLELANGFHELTDEDEQRRRFEEERALRRTLGKKTWPVDEAFLRDLPNMGEAVGMAFGVDRFVMLLTGATSINDVLPFSARERFTH